jgi:NADPH:quinone reductase-like Zn-dependent oxidoreductase
MRAISQQAFGGPEVLQAISTTRPVPGPGEVLVRVHAAGVNPSDWKRRSGLLPGFGEPPFTVGLDLSGTVEAAGGQVTRFRPGDAVHGAVLPPRGSYAEYVTVPQGWLAPLPPGLGHVQAAALPTAALTAWQSLVRIAGIRPGQRVLIHAAAGGVGHLAVQIAKAYGAHVIATARDSHHAFLRALGADDLIDYTTADFAARARDINIVLDPVSGDYGPRSLDTLAPGGILLDVRGTGPDRTATRDQAAARGLRYAEFRFTPSGTDLENITALARQGSIRAAVDRTLPLGKAALAHELSQTGHVAGKIVLTVP